jgi:hypothetical protein
MALFSIDILGLTLGTPKASDNYVAVDVTDPTMAVVGTDKRYLLADIFSFVVHGLGFTTLPSTIAASTANYNATYNNGIGGINATLTDASGTFAPFTIDGIPGVVSSLTTPNAYLIKNQTNPAQNGIYFLTINGNGTSIPWVLIRAPYFNSPSNIINGAVTMVEFGLTQASTAWQLNAPGTITVGTTALNWVPFALLSTFITLPLLPQFGGTGIANAPTSTITLGGSLQTIGAFPAIFNFTGATNVTFPTTGTLASTSQLPVFPITVPQGGSGDTSFTAFALIAGGTTSTGNLQNVVGTGTLNQVLVSQGAGALPIWSSVPGLIPAALTEVNDTNVTMTLGGTPATALLQAVSMTLGWTGQLAVPRGGTGNSTFTAYSVICAGTTATGAFQNVVGTGTLNQVLVSQGAGALPIWSTVPGVVPAAMTEVNDTNVTLTLGGTPATSLLQAVSLTLGWTGQLSVPRGGTGLSAVTIHNLLIGNGTSALNLLAPSATSGVPLISQGAAADPVYGTAVVAGGGTGNTTFTAYSVICAGTTATAPFQNVVGVGTLGQVLTSQGAAALPQWVSPASSGTVTSIATNNGVTGGTITTTGTIGLAAIANNTLLANISGGSLFPSSTTLTGLIDSAISNVQGDILYRNATTWVVLPPGTAGQVLSTGGAAANPSWINAPGTGTVASGTINQLAWYAATGTTVSGLGTVASAVLTTVASVPTWASELSLALGGTNAALTASNGGIFYSTASAGAILSGTATAGLALLSGASGAPTWSTSKPITKVNVQTFTASGTYTPTTGMTYCIIEVVGGGGGGGGRASSAGCNAGGGGGSGSYSRHLATSAAIGSSQTVTIGGGGAGGAAGANVGSAGTNTSVGSLCIGIAGSGGGTAAAGSQCAGGAGGAAGTGNILTLIGSTGDAGLGTSISTIVIPGGAGGVSYFGGGAGSSQATTSGANGAANTGSGGSGGVSFSSSGNVAGGNGGTGVAIITEYISV